MKMYGLNISIIVINYVFTVRILGRWPFNLNKLFICLFTSIQMPLVRTLKLSPGLHQGKPGYSAIKLELAVTEVSNLIVCPVL